MEPSRPGPYSYIIRVWVEQDDGTHGDIRLRGSISYVVVDGMPAERSFSDLDIIPRFIQAHLRSIGVLTGRRRAPRKWLTRMWSGR